MIIHIFYESKFIPRIQDNYGRAFECENRYIIVGSTKQKWTSTDTFVVDHGNVYDFVRKLSGSQSDIVILHGLDPWKVNLGLRLLDHVKVIPSLWGVEVMMSYPMTLRDIYESETYRFIMRNKGLAKRSKSYLSFWLPYQVKNKLHIPSKNLLKLLGRVPFISGVLDTECQMIIDYNILNARYIPLPVTCLEHSGGNIGREIDAPRDKILLGHANSVLANHVDMMSSIKDHILPDQKVIVPLSYGSAGESYKNFVLNNADDLLGGQCMPLTDLMPIQDYFDLVGSSVAYLAPQRIQAGLGNIYTLLYEGVNVYLPETNPTFTSLKNLGIFVSSLDELRSGNVKVQPIGVKEAEMNREIIYKLKRRSTVIQMIQKSLQTVWDN